MNFVAVVLMVVLVADRVVAGIKPFKRVTTITTAQCAILNSKIKNTNTNTSTNYLHQSALLNVTHTT